MISLYRKIIIDTKVDTQLLTTTRIWDLVEAKIMTDLLEDIIIMSIRVNIIGNLNDNIEASKINLIKG